MSRRAGLTLVEVVVAATLGAAVAVAATGLWRVQRRVAEGLVGVARAASGAQEVLDVATALVRSAASARLSGDSALVLRQVVRDGILCADGRGFRVLAPIGAASGPSASGDEWWEGGRDSSTAAWRWLPRADTLIAMSACASAAPTRLVRVTRTTVVTSYHAGDGDWMLGARTCAALACGVVQPIAGPLRSRANAGFRVRGDGMALVLSARVPGVGDTVERRVPWR